MSWFAKRMWPWIAAIFGQATSHRCGSTLQTFDDIFAVLKDDDDQKLASIGLEARGGAPSNTEIEELVAARQAARTKRDFAKADHIRQDLANRGVILEDSKDGIVRWKRK